jgi:demethylmenaquinone methyltransferase/2-methoxy-6-polyprenyl-1,4-benzoquinol methylase
VFPDQQQLARLFEQTGFEQVGFRNLSFGIACLHSGTRPAQDAI